MTDDPRGRTYSSWWFLAVFTVLAGLGLAGLLLVGTPSGPTELVPTAQTLPVDDEAATATTSSSTTEPAVPATDEPASSPDPLPEVAPTFADGTAAPDGVTEILVDGDTTVLAFSLAEGTDPGQLESRVAPVSAAILDGGRVLGVRVGCADSADAVLAQLAVVETSDAVTVTAVALVPSDGAPCVPGAESASVEVPLRAPLGDRSVRVTPPGDPAGG